MTVERMARPATWGRIILWIVLGGAIIANLVNILLVQETSWLFMFPAPVPPDWVVHLAASGVALMLLVALAVTLTRRWPNVAASSRFKPTPIDNRHLVAFTVFYVAATLPSIADPPAAVEYVWYYLVYFGAVLGLAWMWLRGSFRTTLRRDWGLHLGRHFLVETSWGLAAYVGFWCLWKTLAACLNKGGLEYGSSSAFWPWWAPPSFLFLSLIYAPIVEEAFFRGALYRELRRSLKWFGATVVVAVAFTAVHYVGTWSRLLHLLLIGFVLCVLREWRDSLAAPMVMHLALNGLPRLLRLLDLPAYLI